MGRSTTTTTSVELYVYACVSRASFLAKQPARNMRLKCGQQYTIVRLAFVAFV